MYIFIIYLINFYENHKLISHDFVRTAANIKHGYFYNNVSC